MTEPATFTPNYAVTFRTFLNSFDKMAELGFPATLDRSYLTWLAGGLRSYFITMARTWVLIDGPDDVPTQRLRDLVENPETRPEIIGQVVREQYAPIFDLGQQSTFQGLTDKWIEIYDQRGETRTKAIRFFLQATDYAGISVSPHWKRGMTSSGNAASPRPKRRTRRSIAQRDEAIPTQRDADSGTHTFEADLQSGAGQICLEIKGLDLFQLSGEDREFVFAIIDTLRDYRSRTTPAQGPDTTNDADDEPAALACGQRPTRIRAGPNY